MNIQRSKKAFQEARLYIPGGVDSPVRAFKSIGQSPLFIDRAEGPYLYDLDGNRYIDHCLSWGVHILGHNHAGVVAAVKRTLVKGTSFGAPTILETELAKQIIASVPSIERIRFVSSGTEAVMSAIRVARAFTKRDKIIKFDGCYHGHADHLLVAAGSGVSRMRHGPSTGVPHAFTGETISVPYNDSNAVERAFTAYRGKIAAVIVEPVPANMGVIVPHNGFLDFLRHITKRNKSLLIFDEVITGFRWNRGGAQAHFNILPDLTTLGKIIGGGFPVGAFGGRKDIMDLLAPTGCVYQAGTLSGNPIAMAAGIAVLNHVAQKDFYSTINARSARFFADIAPIAYQHGITLNAIGTMFSIFFSKKPVTDCAALNQCDTKRFARFYRSMLNAGIYLSPAQGEAHFVSLAHTDAILADTRNTILRTLDMGV